jgi:hypothetical protein
MISTLQSLPYVVSSLEPFTDTKTMNIHLPNILNVQSLILNEEVLLLDNLKKASGIRNF